LRQALYLVHKIHSVKGTDTQLDWRFVGDIGFMVYPDDVISGKIRLTDG